MPEKTEAERQRFLSALERAGKRFPEMRLCQIIVNACGPDPFYADDENAAQRLDNYTRSNIEAARGKVV